MTREQIDKWNAFIDDVREVQKKHGVEIDTGCDCCFYGHTLDGVEVKYTYKGHEGEHKLVALEKLDYDRTIVR